MIVLERKEDYTSEMFANSLDKIEAACNNLSIPIVKGSYNAIDGVSVFDTIPDCPSIIYGSIRFTRRYKGDSIFYGGDTSFLETSRHFNRNVLLNGSYVSTTFGDLRNNLTYWQNTLGNEIFVRPNSGNKVFSGQVIKDMYDLVSIDHVSSVMDSTVIILDSAKDVESEERFFVVDGKIIQGTGYPDNRKPKLVEFAQSLVDIHRPDDAFTIDVCKSNNIPKLVEFNSFSNAGIYHADAEIIIKHLMEIL